MEDYRVRIGKLITNLRTRQNLTQVELAQKLSTSQSAINRIEKGSQNVSLDILSRLSSVLGCDIISIGSPNKLSLKITGGHKLNQPDNLLELSASDLPGLITASLVTRSEITLPNISSPELVDFLEIIEQLGGNISFTKDHVARSGNRDEIAINSSDMVCPDLFEISAQKYSRYLWAIIPVLVMANGVSIVYDLSSQQIAIVNILRQFNIKYAFHNSTLIILGGNVARASGIVVGDADYLPLATLLALPIPNQINLIDASSHNYPNQRFYTLLKSLGAQIETLHEI